MSETRIHPRIAARVAANLNRRSDQFKAGQTEAVRHIEDILRILQTLLGRPGFERIQAFVPRYEGIRTEVEALDPTVTTDPQTLHMLVRRLEDMTDRLCALLGASVAPPAVSANDGDGMPSIRARWGSGGPSLPSHPR